MLFKKIIAVLCSIAISFLVMAAPVAAVDAGTVIAGAGVAVDFFGFAADMYDRWKAANPNTPDSEYPGFNPGGSYGGGAGRDDLPAAYDEYVGTLPSSNYGSGGELRWRLNVRDYSYYDDEGSYVVSFSGGTEYSVTLSSTSVRYPVFLWFSEFKAPVTGRYTLYHYGFGDSSYCLYTSSSSKGYYFITLSKGADKDISLSSNKFVYSDTGRLMACDKGTNIDYSAGTTIFEDMCFASIMRDGGSGTPSASGYFEVVCTPTSSPSGTYNTNTRPTSITGGNYGVVGDNNEITMVQDNSTIVNETNNTYYNPATGMTVPITDWSYDYSDRSYKVTMESGDTATITYGDENISITETNTTSGDTITNNYTIYYLVEGSGSDTPVDPPVDPPAACTHNWTDTSTTPASCTVPGSKLLTCSLCSQTKTESIPALGHDWQVKETVATEYDDTGQLTQQGYTIFECSRCHEQYKSEDGVLPPDVPGDTDTALVEAVRNKLKLVAEAVLGIFDELPKLFSGFTDFLVAVFPFLPSEVFIIIELGFILMIAAAVLKKWLL